MFSLRVRRIMGNQRYTGLDVECWYTNTVIKDTQAPVVNERIWLTVFFRTSTGYFLQGHDGEGKNISWKNMLAQWMSTEKLWVACIKMEITQSGFGHYYTYISFQERRIIEKKIIQNRWHIPLAVQQKTFHSLTPIKKLSIEQSIILTPTQTNLMCLVQ